MKHPITKESAKKIRRLAKANRKVPTEAEARLWRFLRAHRLEGYKFKRQYPIAQYIVDFVCLEKNLVIELDGGYHGDDRCYRLDEERTAALEKFGFRVMRFWNWEIMKDPDSVWYGILQALEEMP